MNYYLDHFTAYTWNAFQEHGRTVSGYPDSAKGRAAAVEPGDIFICYLVRLSRWCGAIEVVEGPYIDNKPIFSPVNDKYVVRFRVDPLVVLDPEFAIPIGELWSELNCTKGLDRNKTGWVWSAKLRISLTRMDAADGQLIVQRLQAQGKVRRSFPLDPGEQRLLRQRPVMTPKGAVEVVIPDDPQETIEETSEVEATQSLVKGARESIAIQATLASIGARMGYAIWVPRNDRAAVRLQMISTEAEKLLDVLPLNYEDTTLRTVEQIDVIWLRGRSIVRAFEVEHTTAVYSGLLRMADLLALQPNIDIRLHIVADEGKREKVFREIKRPVFSLLENGALSESCSYLSYGSVLEISKLPHLPRMTDTIVDDFQEMVE
jgi:hypothetical protein